MRSYVKYFDHLLLLLLLDRIARTLYVDAVYCVTDRVTWSFGRSVCHTSESCKTAEQMKMPFGLRTPVGLGKHVLYEGPDLVLGGAL